MLKRVAYFFSLYGHRCSFCGVSGSGHAMCSVAGTCYLEEGDSLACRSSETALQGMRSRKTEFVLISRIKTTVVGFVPLFVVGDGREAIFGPQGRVLTVCVARA